jgi:hypothetical protein
MQAQPASLHVRLTCGCCAAGHSKERYVRRMVAELVQAGWVVVVYNRRGHKQMEFASKREAESTRHVKMSYVALEKQGSASLPSSPQSDEIMAARSIYASAEDSSTFCDASNKPNKCVADGRKVWPMYCDMADMHDVRCPCIEGMLCRLLAFQAPILQRFLVGVQGLSPS